jgi:hypothetical protein
MVSLCLYMIAYYGPQKGCFDNASLYIVRLGPRQAPDPNPPLKSLMVQNLFKHKPLL